MITASAPGKIILFGEHAVVYDKLGIACTINKWCTVRVSPIRQNIIIFDAKDLGFKKSFTEKELFNLFEKVKKLKNKSDFGAIKEIYQKYKFPPSLFVVATILKKYGFTGMKIEGDSEIPKNLGSSSASFAAISLAVLKLLKKDPSKKEVSDLAYLGDVLAHGGTPSGIDNSVVTYGGYIKYKKSEGITPLDIDLKIPLLIVDSGTRARTGETVSYVRKQREKKPKFVNSILDSLNNISEKALESLNSQSFESLGSLMFEYYQELKKLDISTPKLDQIINIALKNRALGAKPTGGWGGGCCLVLAKTQKEIVNLIKEFKINGFKSFQSKIGVEGVKII
jgi:mevalonate kinase